MPRTRRLLADQGTTMTQGLAPTPICAPARASLLTGQYAHNHGVLTVEGEAGGVAAFDDRRTLPTWLRTAGYDTMFAGKYLNGYGTKNPRTSRRAGTSWRGSVDFSTYSFFNTKFNVNGTVVKPPGYNTDILARYTEEMLAKHRRGRLSDHPFFMWVNYVAPHHGGPHESDDPKRIWPGGARCPRPPRRRGTATRSATSPCPGPAMWEQDLRGNHHAASRRRAATGPPYARPTSSDWSPCWPSTEAVGRTVAALRRSGELDRTVIALTSDNGFMVGQHNLFGKLWFYDALAAHPDHPARPGIPGQAALDPDHQPRPGRHHRRASPGRGRPAASTGSTCCRG